MASVLHPGGLLMGDLSVLRTYQLASPEPKVHRQGTEETRTEAVVPFVPSLQSPTRLFPLCSRLWSQVQQSGHCPGEGGQAPPGAESRPRVCWVSALPLSQPRLCLLNRRVSCGRSAGLPSETAPDRSLTTSLSPYGCFQYIQIASRAEAGYAASGWSTQRLAAVPAHSHHPRRSLAPLRNPGRPSLFSLPVLCLLELHGNSTSSSFYSMSV